MAFQPSLLFAALALASLVLPLGPCFCHAATSEPHGDQPHAEQPQQAADVAGHEFVRESTVGTGGEGADQKVTADEVDEADKADEVDEDLFEIEGEEDGEKVDDVSYTIANLLFGFLVVDMIILYCINYPDPNIRSYVYSMISTTISIFCAVLINRAVAAFCLEQVLTGPPPLEDSPDMIVRRCEQVVLGLALFGSAFVLVNALGWVLREHPGQNYTYTLRVIGGHITAFAGINAFGNLQKLGLFGCHLATASFAMGFATVALFVARLASGSCRDLLTQRQRDEFAKLAEANKDVEEEEDYLQWSQDVAEAEDDASALILSFLMQQVVLYIITQELPPFEGSTASHTALDIGCLFFGAIGFLAVLILHTHLIIHFKHESRSKTRANLGRMSSWLRRTIITQKFLAMSMSWCLLRAGSWGMQELIKSHAMAQVANALATSMLSLVVIRILDCFADALIPQEVALANRLSCTPFAFPPTPAMTTPGISTTTSAWTSQGRRRAGSNSVFNWAIGRPVDKAYGSEAQHSSSSDEQEGVQWECARYCMEAGRRFRELLRKFLKASQEPLQQERALRRVIDGFGLLVGLCWDRAFDASDETLVEGSSLGRRHPAVAKSGICIMLVSLVLPAWMWYIVPKARLGWRDHHAEMVGQEEEQDGGLASIPSGQLLSHIVSTPASPRILNMPRSPL